MRPRQITAALLATLALLAAAPAAAHASLRLELQASGVVERLANRHYPGYDFTANCDQYTVGRFWCDVSGSAGDCYRTGHADVKRRVRGRNVYLTVYWRGIGQEDCY